MRTNYITLD